MFRRVLTSAIMPAIKTIGISRHTAVPALRRAAAKPAASSALSFSRQLFSLLLGSALIGIAVALMVHANLGLTPYDVMSSAISKKVGLSLGHAGWALAAVLFAVAAVFRNRPSLWGVGYIVANGLAIDAASGLLTQPDTVPGRWTFVLGAVALLAAGVSLVVYSGTTGGPFELLMKAGEERGVNPLIIRYGLDLGIFGGGVLLGGSFGPATIFYALSFGLVLKLSSQALADHGEGRRARIGFARSSGAESLGGDSLGAESSSIGRVENVSPSDEQPERQPVA